jgi:hypothetical protein
MTETEKLDLLKALEQDRVCLTVFVPTIHGSQECRVTPEQALRMRLDSNGVHGELLGLSREEYSTWIEQGGSVLCSGRTGAGKPCRKSIAGGTLLEAQTWRELNGAGGYCSVHGG